MKKKKRQSSFWLFRFWSFGILLLFVLFLPGQNYYETLQLEFRPALVRAIVLGDFTPNKYPLKSGSEAPPTISAESFIVADLESGVVFTGKNPTQKLRPASITKLMTALVALEYYNPNQILTVNYLPFTKGESEMRLAVGDQVSVQNLVYGLLVPSGNDAAYTLADNYPGGTEQFIYSMNKKADELHMKNTHFENPSGVDSDSHYTSAKDIATLAEAALKNSFIAKVVATHDIILTDITGKRVYAMKNVNQFLGYLSGADGVKTGFTDLAGECLVASVSRSGHRVVSVVLKSEDRFGESSKLLEWVYRNFTWIAPHDN